MFAAVFATLVRPAAGQITIGNSGAFLSLFRDRKLSLSGYKVDKTVSRLRRN
jgi:hypothetical protein